MRAATFHLIDDIWGTFSITSPRKSWGKLLNECQKPERLHREMFDTWVQLAGFNATHLSKLIREAYQRSSPWRYVYTNEKKTIRRLFFEASWFDWESHLPLCWSGWSRFIKIKTSLWRSVLTVILRPTFVKPFLLTGTC